MSQRSKNLLFGGIAAVLITALLYSLCLGSIVVANESSVIEYATEVTTEPSTEPSPAFIISTDERETLARLIYLEARGESYECQKAIASVVVNRWMSGYWGNTINSVIYAKGQFTPANRIKYTTPNETNYAAVDEVLQNGTTLPYYVMYFRAGYHHRWRGYTGYTVIDNTYFGYKNSDKPV